MPKNLPTADAIRQIAIELTAISESALAYCKDPFDIERFHRIHRLAHDLLSPHIQDAGSTYPEGLAAVAGYATPKLDVRGAVFSSEGEVLLVQEKADGDRWTLPGGWCDVLESPSSAVEREVKEEAGVSVQATQLAAVLDRELWPHVPALDHHVYKLLFICQPREGSPVDLTYTSNETSGIGWFPIDALPELAVGRILPEQIALAHSHWKRPRPTTFD